MLCGMPRTPWSDFWCRTCRKRFAELPSTKEDLSTWQVEREAGTPRVFDKYFYRLGFWLTLGNDRDPFARRHGDCRELLARRPQDRMQRGDDVFPPRDIVTGEARMKCDASSLAHACAERHERAVPLDLISSTVEDRKSKARRLIGG